MAVATYTKTGTKATSPAKLSKDVFGITDINDKLLNQAVVTYLANGRDVLAKTKDRSEVRGGGRKPWRQKGTGRARHGSRRSPIWSGGGITFGPTGAENFSKQMNKKAKRAALRQALSLAAANDTVKVIADLDFKDGRTATAAKLFEKLSIDRAVLLVVDTITDEIRRATNNIPFVEVVQASYLNTYKVLTAHNLVFTKKALEAVESNLETKK